MKFYKSIFTAFAVISLGVISIACDNQKEEEETPDIPAAPEVGTVIFSNNFDKEKVYKDSNAKWPYCDQTDAWKNETGLGASTVEYEVNGASVRTNVSSDPNEDNAYSLYQGSGVNNLLLGSNSYLKVNNIDLNAATTLTLSFGAYRYGGVFDHEKLPVQVSADGEKWVEISYSFASGSDPDQSWDLAVSNFTVPAGTKSLYLYFPAKEANSIRLDDITLVVGDVTGEVLDFSAGSEDQGNGSFQGEYAVPADAVYFNDFDKERAYQSDNKWPYLDQTEIWKNEQGSGIATVSYLFSSTSVRTTSSSSGNYSKYKGSGLNNLLLGTKAYFQVNTITLPAGRSYSLSVGTSKSEYGATDNTFKHDEFFMYIGEDGENWISLEYTFKGGQDLNGFWDEAVSTFTLPASTKTLYVHFEASVASAYRLDDVLLVPSSEAGKSIDFSEAVPIGYDPDAPTEIKDVTIAELLAEKSSEYLYRITGTVGGPVNTTYGNYDVIQGEDKIFVYGTKNFSDYSVEEGGTITVYGQYKEYNGKDELCDVVIESYIAPEKPEAKDPVKVTVAEFLAAEVSDDQPYELTGVIGGSINTTYGNFDLTDETGTVYVYGLTATNLGYGTKNDNSYSSLGLKKGDTVTIIGYRGEYNGKDEVTFAYYVSHVPGETLPDEGEVEVSGKQVTISVPDIAANFAHDEHETYGEGWKANVDGVEIGVYQYTNTNSIPQPGTEIRVYSGAALTIKGATNIKKVKLYCVSKIGDLNILSETNPENNRAEGNKDSMTITWVGDLPIFEAQAGGQSRVEKLELVFAE